MARKKYDDEQSAHDRWLVSYADFITLLFAFFVVMYALSSVNEGKYRALSSSLVSAFGSTSAKPVIGEAAQVMPIMPKPVAQHNRRSDVLQREKEQLTGIARDILKVLAPLVDQGKVRVTQSGQGIVVDINASVLFAPGEAGLTNETGQALKAIAAILKNDNHAIQVEGHTDSMPINNAYFPSNWELSAVRASSVVRLLIDSGIAENRLSAVGRGATQPVGSNEAPEGRLRNRRVAIMILSRLTDGVKEVPVVPVK